MPKSWTLLPPTEPSPALIQAVGGHPLVAQLLAQRGIATPEQARAFMDPTAYTPAPPSALGGVDESAHLLQAAIQDGQHLLVWGDFDVDGQTSTSLLVDALRRLAGWDRVHYHVPNRFSEGHGILPEKLAAVLDELPPIGLMLTCDTGIAEGPAIGYAKDRGLTVAVTDHHDLTPEFQTLPPGDPVWGQEAATVGQESVRRADAIVNPKFQPPGDPLRTLPGVGVAYKLIEHLYALSGRRGEETDLLDLVALGIVADVAEQVHDARYLLQLGLEQLRNTRRVGLKALMEVARLDPAKVDAESIGFQLGPRMNALGRLEDATVAVELLTTDDAIRAGQLAAKMERLNQQRRLLTSQITAAAMEMIDKQPWLLEFNGLVLAHPAWHAGIVGIVASRLVEEFGKPTVLLLTPPGQPARGSARSVPGVDIGASIAACSHLLIGHGGHPGAAGLSLPAENIDAFRRELSRQIDAHRIPDAPTGLQVDAVMPLEELSIELAEELQRLAPFGNGNPAPRLMSRNLAIVQDRRMGKDGSHRKLTVASVEGGDAEGRREDGEGKDLAGETGQRQFWEETSGEPVRDSREAPRQRVTQQVVWFNGGDAEVPAGPIDLLYQLNINEYRGRRSLQLMYVDIHPAGWEIQGAPEAEVQIPPLIPGELRVHDLRRQPVTPADLPDRAAAQWYAEGARLPVAERAGADEVAFAPRTAIVHDPDRPLVVWSVPPSPNLLRWLVETAGAQEVYLCAQETTDDNLPTLLKQVAGLCKYALGRDRLLNVEAMAARLGTSEAAVHKALAWLEQRGLIALVEWSPDDAPADTVHIAPGGGERHDDESELLQAQLLEELAEVRARRRFYRRATIAELGLTAGATQRVGS